MKRLVLLILLGGAGCYNSNSSHGGNDAATDDGAGPGSLRIEIVNVSSDRNAFVDACPHCNEAWLLRSTVGAGEELTLPGLLACRCSSCSSSRRT